MKVQVHRILVCLLGLIAVLLLNPGYGVLAQGVAVPSAPPARLVTISDIHGAYTEFVSLLRAADLVDSELHWSGGEAQLVIIGDVLDRGEDARRCLDLIISLEQEAKDAGGSLHFVLGNHEIMNLAGDLRYVTTAGFAAYLPEEDPEERARARLRFFEQNRTRFANEQESATVFDSEYPPGFFGHRKVFAAEGKYGSWLLGKPVIKVINESAFLHAGLAPAYIGTTVDDINEKAHTELSGFIRYRDELMAAGLIYPETPFMQLATAAQNAITERNKMEGTVTEPLLETSRQLDRLIQISDLFGGGGVAWYRGMVACNPSIEESRVMSALQTLGVDRLIVGHTPTHEARVLERFGDKLIRADTGMLASYYNGKPAAVIIEKDEVSVLYPEPLELVRPQPQSRQVGIRPYPMSDDELESLLLTAEIIAQGPAENGSITLTLGSGTARFEGEFIPAKNSRAGRIFIPEVAAYRLDKLLNVDMVPVAVLRELDGKPGALRLPAGALMNDLQRHEQNLGAAAWCPLADQFNLMYILDSLLGNSGRSRNEMRYDQETWQMILTGNHDILGVNKKLPAYLANVDLLISPALLDNLKSLDADRIRNELGDVLDRSAQTALLARRDLLLEIAAEE